MESRNGFFFVAHVGIISYTPQCAASGSDAAFRFHGARGVGLVTDGHGLLCAVCFKNI